VASGKIKILLILIILGIPVQTVSAMSAEKILEHVYKTEYVQAFGEISNMAAEDSSACVLKGIAFVTRFDDLGDTLDLDSALSILRKCKTSGFWEPMRRYQVGLINSILGNTIRSIVDVRGAAIVFAERSDIDSKAFYAIYAYYAPFTKFRQDDLKNGFEQSKMFSPVFGNSLIWILYEEKKYSSALNVANSLLERYPSHPVILQTRADMLFKLGRVQEAVSIYEQSEALYAKRAPNSIRYWCAVANLAKMTKDNKWREKLQSKEYKRIRHWMPESI